MYSLYIRSIQHIHLYFKVMDGVAYRGERNRNTDGLSDREDIERVH